MRWLFITWICLCGLLGGCTQLFFQPSAVHGLLPSDIGYDYEDVYLYSAEGVRIHGWLVEPVLAEEEAAKGVVYFLHGNAQNISWHIHGARWLLDDGYRVFALDYRGYGRSTGIATLPGAYTDLSMGFDWFKEHVIDENKNESEQAVILFGQSLGASLGLNWLASYPKVEEEFTHMVLDSGFSRFGTVAREIANTHWLTWLFQYPAQWFLSDELDPVESIQDLSLPILLLHSQDDQVVGFHHSSALLSAGGPNVHRISATGPHIAGLRDPKVREAAFEWLLVNAAK